MKNTNANKTSKTASGPTGAVDPSEDRRSGTQEKAIPRQTKFDERCEALKGHILD